MNLQHRLHTFSEGRRALLAEMARMDPAALEARPLARKWSLGAAGRPPI